MDVLEQIAGILAIVAGIWLIYPPAAIIIGGLLLAVHGTIAELNRKDEDGTRESDESSRAERNQAA